MSCAASSLWRALFLGALTTYTPIRQSDLYRAELPALVPGGRHHRRSYDPEPRHHRRQHRQRLTGPRPPCRSCWRRMQGSYWAASARRARCFPRPGLLAGVPGEPRPGRRRACCFLGASSPAASPGGAASGGRHAPRPGDLEGGDGARLARGWRRLARCPLGPRLGRCHAHPRPPGRGPCSRARLPADKQPITRPGHIGGRTPTRSTTSARPREARPEAAVYASCIGCCATRVGG